MSDSDESNGSNINLLIYDPQTAEKWNLQHNSVLKRTKLICGYFVIVNSIGTFSQSLWLNLWIYYALMFNENNYKIIWFGYAHIIMSLFGISIFSDFCYKFGFDNTLIVFVAVRLCGFILLLFNNDQFYQFFIGILVLSLTNEDSLIFSIPFLTKLLPVKYSSIFINYQYSTESLLFIIGTFVSGLLPFKITYLCATSLSIGSLIFSIIYTRKTEQQLMTKQLAFISFYNNTSNSINEYDKDEIFPLCAPKSATNSLTFPQFLVNNAYVLLFVAQYSITTSLELIFLCWFPVYCNERYQDNYSGDSNMITMISTTINAFGILIITIWSIILPYLYKKYSKLNDNKIIIIFICYTLQVIIWIVAPLLNNIYYWFIIIIPLRTVYSICFISLDLQLMSMQSPSRMTQTVKLGLKYIVGSFCMLIIGIIWSTDVTSKFTKWMCAYIILPATSSIFLSIAVISKPRALTHATHIFDQQATGQTL